MTAETLDLLLEIGTEELPPKSLPDLSAALHSGITRGLSQAGIAFGATHPYATPRRLALLIHDLATHQPDQIVERRGPALNAAYTADGAPTKALEGFARGAGVRIDQLITLKTDKGEWLGLSQTTPGQPTAQLIPDILRAALAQLPIARRMRWGAGEAEFVRPVHWVVLMLGDAVIDADILGCPAGRTTRGHRIHHPEPIRLARPRDYPEALRTAHVLADFTERRAVIRTQAEHSARAAGGVAHIEESLLDEVTALVEWPVPIVGHFEERFLKLPPEVLITTMQANQKYFPIKDGNGQQLTSAFITFANLESTHPEVVRAGNERVVRPRLTDAEFFWNQDRKKTLDSRTPALGQIVFQNKLGSILDKTHRVERLAAHIAGLLNVDATPVRRAAQLAKADLLTEMVGEFPELQGLMGRYYARADGETEAVAQAIEEHYLPKHSGGALPASGAGRILALAEKIDTLTGIFSAGLLPSGDKDPYALRRAALGIVRIAIECHLALNIVELLEFAVRGFEHDFDHQDTREKVRVFILERLRGYAQDRGHAPDGFEAVAAVPSASLPDFMRKLEAVAHFRTLPESQALTAANKRIGNLLKKVENPVTAPVEEARFVQAQERTLNDAALAAGQDIAPLIERADYTTALQRLSALRPAVDAFFDQVMVMADDVALRENRIALLTRVQGLFLNVADIARLQSE